MVRLNLLHLYVSRGISLAVSLRPYKVQFATVGRDKEKTGATTTD
jgi:hypothetical protein